MPYRLILALLLAAGPAFGQTQDIWPGERGTQPAVRLGPDDDSRGDRPVVEPSPPEPASAAQIDSWRQALMGKPVHGRGTGPLGRVAGLAVGIDGQVTAVVVALEGAGREGITLPAPFGWVRHQIGDSVISLPWTPVDLDWLTRGGTARSTYSLAGFRRSWLAGAEAVLEQGEAFGQVEGLILDDTGQASSIVLRHASTGRLYPVPRERVRVEGERRVVVSLPAAEILTLQPLVR